MGLNWDAILILCALGILVPVLFYFLFPETAGKALEEIAVDEGDEDGNLA